MADSSSSSPPGFVHSYFEALLAACVTAIASWPLYRQFTARMPRWMGRGAASLVFTFLMVLFVLAPLLFAFGALLTEAHALLLGIAAADEAGIAVPHWLENIPWLAGSSGRVILRAREPSGCGRSASTRPCCLTGAQSLGQFMFRHLFIIAFTILVLFFLYQEGERLAEDFLLVLRHRIGERAEAYVELATRAVRASVNSMLLVGLLAGFATGLAYAVWACRIPFCGPQSPARSASSRSSAMWPSQR